MEPKNWKTDPFIISGIDPTLVFAKFVSLQNEK